MKEFTRESSKNSNKVLLIGASLLSINLRQQPPGPQEVAKGHTDAGITDRASTAYSAVGDKSEEHGHEDQSEAHKRAGAPIQYLTFAATKLKADGP